jgi:hypothetical protein
MDFCILLVSFLRNRELHSPRILPLFRNGPYANPESELEYVVVDGNGSFINKFGAARRQ